MNCRTGDILAWRSTGFYDTLSEVTIGIKGLHSGLILVGNKFSQISVCGKSPSNTYVTYLVDQVFPIEEIVGHVWTRDNGASLHHIHRIGGPDINENIVMDEFQKLLNMKTLPTHHTIYISIVAYLKCGNIVPATDYDDQRSQVCSIFIGYLLNKFGLLSEDFNLSNILPIDFYNLTFYQKYPYEHIVIFDKGTYDIQWWFSGFLINAGVIEPVPVCDPNVESILVNYQYPKFNRNNLKRGRFLNGFFE